MISLELWRSRIGGYISRGRKDQNNAAASNLFNILAGKKFRFSSLVRLVLIVLLIIGGVEQNPGPPKKVVEEQKEKPETMETREELSVVSDYVSDSIFTLPTSSITTSKPIGKYKHFGAKKRSKIFPKKLLCSDSNSESDEIFVDSQTSVTEDFDSICKIPRLSRASSQSSVEMPPEVPQKIPTSSRQTTAQKKLEPDIEIIPCDFRDVQYLNVEKTSDVILKFSELSTCLFECNILGTAIGKIFCCKSCGSNDLRFYKSTFTGGIVEHVYILCDSCHSGTDFYNSQKITFQTLDNRNHFINNILQILGGRLVGIGKPGLDIINSILGMPKTLGKRAFYDIQKFLSHSVLQVARKSCVNAANELRQKFCTPENDMLGVEVSYDGAYQRRGGSKGGGHSRYCFAGAISIESGKVLDFEVACNSCRLCTEKQQALRENRIDKADYDEWFSKHEENCQAKEYGDINSVGLESKLAPVIFERSTENKLLYSSVIADGDDKSISILNEKKVYAKYQVDISRQECLSHVQKRIKGHLFEKQKNYVEKMKIAMNTELSSCKSKSQEKNVREKYRKTTKRDLKHDRDIWGSHSGEISEINLLSDSMIDKITSLYGLVIKNNQHQLITDIQNALFGIINHLSANEVNCVEMHKFCQQGEDSWCHYQKAISLGVVPPKHPNFLSEECRLRVLDILAPYMSLNFLEKVKGGKTSNLNENLHKLIWEHVPKTGSVEIDLMHLGAALAVIRFNEGWSGYLKIFEELGIKPKLSFLNIIAEHDARRLSDSVGVSSEAGKKHRWGIKRSKRMRKRTGQGYKSGKYSGVVDDSISLGTDEDEGNCTICGGNEDTGIIGVASRNKDATDNWIQCDICSKWSHFFCLRQTKHLLEMPKEDEKWFCPGCNRS